MIPYKYGDIVLVSFPFTNLKTLKKRPAVIISSASYQRDRPDIILMAITSQIRQPLSMGEVILQDWQQAGLLKPSLLKPLIATLEKGNILNVLGSLSRLDQKNLEITIQNILGA